jgi:Holliday junction resolvasome RuvABC endonuclease subunit
MIIISIDPGYERLGIAVIEKNKKEKEQLLYSECFKTKASEPHHKRLALIGNKIAEVVSQLNLQQKNCFSVATKKLPCLLQRPVVLFSTLEAL